MTPRPLIHAAVVLATAGVLLTACGPGGGGAQQVTDEPVRVVASTNVYGDIVRSIGGPDVAVTSVLTSPDQDPHSFEANPRTALDVSKADLLIENGGGYDDYMDRLRAGSTHKAPVVNVVELLGKKPAAGGELNEHVWYDVAGMQEFATDIAGRLGRLNKHHAQAYADRAKQFNAGLDPLIKKEHALASQDQGKAIGITEPVPLYMTEACGLTNKTPAKFSQAIEEGDDVSASVLQETLDLYRNKQVAALLYNVQTGGPITEQVKAAAQAAGVGVVPVTETLPTGKHYTDWMSDNLDAIATAVSK